jgi:DivIVA domain-containing protein
MNDEAFHLTPVDARRYDFGSALRGYDKARVDQFRDQVADELERLARVNQELEAKAKGFHEQLRAFRERDKALNDALISAQQLRAETREQAEREAQLVLREARAEGEKVVEEARSEVRRLQTELDALERSRRTYVAQLRALAERQLAELSAAESGPAPTAAATKKAKAAKAVEESSNGEAPQAAADADATAESPAAE